MSASQLCAVLFCALAAGQTLSAWLWHSSDSLTDSDPVVVQVVVEEPPANESVEPRVLDVSDLPSHRLRAEAAVVYNPETNEIVWGTDVQQQRPIASITKVMTALVVLDQQIDLTRDVVVSARDVRRASTTYLRRRERVTLDNLMHLALIASDNAAARVLARATGLGTKEFIRLMNQKANELGLQDTQFVDPSGLHENNLSTPYDVARLITTASREPTIARIMRNKTYRLRTSRRGLTIRNTNRLLRGRYSIQAGKTGYIDEAGFCLATVVKLPGKDPLAVVVLGAGSNAGRFREVRRLVDWVSTKGQSLIEPVTLRAD
jgi:D-alanyl-D-alanine endopeptidase (penicillin-binding protein 7)